MNINCKKKKIKIIGIGNILSGNDGIGPKVIYNLQKMKDKYPILNDIEIIDLGSCGLDLLFYLENVDIAIIIDSVYFNNDSIGSVLRVDGEELISSTFNINISTLHDLSLREVLIIGNNVQKIPKILFYGINIGLKKANDFNILELTMKIDAKIKKKINEICLFIIDDINNLLI